MSEPPIETGPDGVQPHAPRIGHRWLDLTVAAVAIVISLISLAVAFFNAQSEQRMVAASSWPYLVYGTKRSQGVTGELSMSISNEGVGPARLKSLVVGYNGRKAHGLIELLHLCCGLPPGTSWTGLLKLGLVRESRPVGIYSPRDSLDIVVLDRTAANAAMWDRLATARLHLSFAACYCSVLDDCWVSDLSPVTDPRPVDRCEATDGYVE